MRSYLSFVLILATAILSSACGQDDRLNQGMAEAGQRIHQLSGAITKGDLRNATLIREYAEVVARDHPDLAAIVATLRKESTTDGQEFKRLQRRLEEVKQLGASYGDPKLLLDETRSIAESADPAIFDMALADVVNVLADMSKGKLARVGVLSKAAEKGVNDAKDYGPGGQLVGNPSYGQWANHSGTSFWEWYGMYSLFSNVMGGSRIFYNDWDRHRPYSFYQDRIVDRYGSPLTRRKWGRNWSSSYQKSGARNFSRARKKSSFSRGSSTSSSSRSGQASSRSSFFGSGSFRRSSSYRRGFRGGK